MKNKTIKFNYINGVKVDDIEIKIQDTTVMYAINGKSKPSFTMDTRLAQDILQMNYTVIAVVSRQYKSIHMPSIVKLTHTGYEMPKPSNADIESLKEIQNTLAQIQKMNEARRQQDLKQSLDKEKEIAENIQPVQIVNTTKKEK